MADKPRIMIVEDEFIAAATIKSSLIKKGFAVGDIVARGEDVLGQAMRQTPDLVLMDVELAGEIDGITAAEMLKEKTDVSIIFLTAYDDPGLVEKAKLAGPYGYIVKPVNINDLVISINIALNRQDLEKKIRSSEQQQQAVLEKHKGQLESMVEKRTQELVEANITLQLEVEQRRAAQEKLEAKEKQVSEQAIKLQEANTSLRYLLEQGKNERNEIGDRVVSNLKELVIPHLEAVLKSNIEQTLKNRIEIAVANLNDIMNPFGRHLSSKLIGLTPTELKVADLVKNGMTNKESAEVLNVSFKTIEFHRERIREKLRIKNRRVNLQSYLRNLSQED